MAHILVADDDIVVLKVVEAALQKAGHSVVAVQDGYAAAAKLESEKFELLISDVSMPGGVTGFSLVSTLRNTEKHRSLPVIFITGRTDKTDVVKAMKAGVDDYIIKPIDVTAFLAKVEALLKRKPQATGFYDIGMRTPAMATIEIEVLSIAAHGVQLLSAAPIGFETQFILKSSIFSEMELNSLPVKVMGCNRSTDGYTIVANFIDLSAEDRNKVSAWIAAREQESAAS